MNYTKKQAISLANSASIKNKNGKNWETIVETTFKKNEILPDIKDLNKSLFKTKTYWFYSGGNRLRTKLIDQWLPKFNHIIEDKNSIGDAQIDEFIIATDSLAIDSSKKDSQFGDNYKYIALIRETPDKRQTERLDSIKQNYPTNFEYYIGERGLEEYMDSLTNPVEKKQLPVGKVEWTGIDKLLDNEVNRDLDDVHVYELMDSLLAEMRNGSVRGLVRPLIGIKANGKDYLVDAHHLKKAIILINKFTQWNITEVPVYYLTHLEDCTEEELTMLMSVINVLVKKWNPFNYVGLWEKTYDKLNEEDRKFPYTKLREEMERLNPSDPAKSPILHAFCISDRAEEKDWGNNTKKVTFGKLMFTEEDYTNKYKPIVDSIIKLKERITKTRGVIGKDYINKDTKEKEKSPTNVSSVLRAFATELSVQGTEISDKEVYYQILQELSNGYWDSKNGVLPIWTDEQSYNIKNWRSISNFPRRANEMKFLVRDEIIPTLEEDLTSE